MKKKKYENSENNELKVQTDQVAGDTNDMFNPL